MGKGAAVRTRVVPWRHARPPRHGGHARLAHGRSVARLGLCGGGLLERGPRFVVVVELVRVVRVVLFLLLALWGGFSEEMTRLAQGAAAPPKKISPYVRRT